MVQITEKSQALALRLTPEQRTELDLPVATNSEWATFRNLSTLERTKEFHHAVNLPVANGIVLNPSVSLRLLRLSLILEEFEETVKAMGFELADQDGVGTHDGLKLSVRHVEGTQYDPVETADGLGDLDVVVNGAMLSLGIPSNEVGYEIFCSNMSKLDEDGKPIVNQCQDSQCLAAQSEAEVEPGECQIAGHRQRPDLPIGKVLKPDHYIKANVSAVLIHAANTYGTEEI